MLFYMSIDNTFYKEVILVTSQYCILQVDTFFIELEPEAPRRIDPIAVQLDGHNSSTSVGWKHRISVLIFIRSNAHQKFWLFFIFIFIF